MTILLAALSSLLWGTADFLGGDSTKRLPVLAVTLSMQTAGLVTAAIAAPGHRRAAVGGGLGVGAGRGRGRLRSRWSIFYTRAGARGDVAGRAGERGRRGHPGRRRAGRATPSATTLALVGMAVAIARRAPGCALAPGRIVLTPRGAGAGRARRGGHRHAAGAARARRSRRDGLVRAGRGVRRARRGLERHPRGDRSRCAAGRCARRCAARGAGRSSRSSACSTPPRTRPSPSPARTSELRRGGGGARLAVPAGHAACWRGWSCDERLSVLQGLAAAGAIGGAALASAA